MNLESRDREPNRSEPKTQLLWIDERGEDTFWRRYKGLLQTELHDRLGEIALGLAEAGQLVAA